MVMVTKKQKRKYQPIAGIGFVIIGLYMLLKLNDLKGHIPLTVGIGILLWKF